MEDIIDTDCDIFIYEDDLNDHILYLKDNYLDMRHETFVDKDSYKGIVIDEGCTWDSNGDIYDKVYNEYFNYVEPNEQHSNVENSGINIYSFALQPEVHQPCGTYGGFSRIDDVKLELNFFKNHLSRK